MVSSDPEMEDLISPLTNDRFPDSQDVERRNDGDWKSYNLLSLDGGGIRGYWELLVLNLLMIFVGEAEEELNQGTRTDNAQQCLPCHYFDYIGGSSTGALVAILLGRFRMTVSDCILEYKKLGNRVFGSPRKFHAIRFKVTAREKYNAKKLKRVFQDVTGKRSEQIDESHGDNRIKFPSGPGMCKTFVTSERSSSDKQKVAVLYLIRSYDLIQRTSPRPSRRSTWNTNGTPLSSRTNTGLSSASGVKKPSGHKSKRKINYGKAHDFEIWEVARAATAAPFYFEPLVIDNGSERINFTDGGFSETNNPTAEGLREITDEHGNDAVGIVVSVGTARSDTRPSRKGLFPILGFLKAGLDKATDPEKIHRDVEEKSNDDASGFSYYRFNEPGLLDIDLDEWKSQRIGMKLNPGAKTIKAMDDAFATWSAQPQIRKLFKDCAHDLVKCRRERASKYSASWETFSTGTTFACSRRGCNQRAPNNRDEFRKHLIQDHGFGKEDIELEMESCKTTWQYR